MNLYHQSNLLYVFRAQFFSSMSDWQIPKWYMPVGGQERGLTLSQLQHSAMSSKKL